MDLLATSLGELETVHEKHREKTAAQVARLATLIVVRAIGK
jgi:hypothetical protein